MLTPPYGIFKGVDNSTFPVFATVGGDGNPQFGCGSLVIDILVFGRRLKDFRVEYGEGRCEESSLMDGLGYLSPTLEEDGW